MVTCTVLGAVVLLAKSEGLVELESVLEWLRELVGRGLVVVSILSQKLLVCYLRKFPQWIDAKVASLIIEVWSWRQMREQTLLILGLVIVSTFFPKSRLPRKILLHVEPHATPKPPPATRSVSPVIPRPCKVISETTVLESRDLYSFRQTLGGLLSLWLLQWLWEVHFFVRAMLFGAGDPVLSWWVDDCGCGGRVTTDFEGRVAVVDYFHLFVAVFFGRRVGVFLATHILIDLYRLVDYLIWKVIYRFLAFFVMLLGLIKRCFSYFLAESKGVFVAICGVKHPNHFVSFLRYALETILCIVEESTGFGHGYRVLHKLWRWIQWLRLLLLQALWLIDSVKRSHISEL